MRRWVWWAIIACQLFVISGQPSDLSDSTILRHNWGVIMEKVKSVKVATEYWSHVFVVELPSVPIPESNEQIQTCEQLTHEQPGSVSCGLVDNVITVLHELHANMTKHLKYSLTHIYDVLPTFSRLTTGSRSSRGLFDFGGEILSGLFGVVSNSDRENIEGRIRQMGQTQVTLSQAFSAYASKTSSYFEAANDRMNGLSNMIVNQQEAMTGIVTEMQERSQDTRVLQAALGTAVSRLAKYVNMLDQINEVRVAVERLAEGYLSPSLIPPKEITRAIREIRHVLANRLPGARLLQNRPHEIYAHPNQVYARQGNKLLILVKFPLTTVQGNFDVFELKSFPVSVPSNPEHETQITELAYAIVVQQHTDYFVRIKSKVQFRNAPFIYLTDIDETFRNNSKPICETAIWKNDNEAVLKLCKFEIKDRVTQSMVKVINDSYVLLSNVNQLTFKCPNGTWTGPGCELCLTKLPCLCEMHADLFYVAPKIQHCGNEETAENRITPINMAVLSHFFDKEDLLGLTGNSATKHKVKVALPLMNIYKHRQNNLLAADRKARYNLKRVSELTKNESVIYHSLADAIADDLQGGGTAVLTTKPLTFTSWITQWESWVIFGSALIAIVALIMSATVSYKLRVVLATLALQKQTSAQQVPTLLDYFATSPTIKSQISNHTTVPVAISETLSKHSFIDVAILTLLALAIVLVLLKMWRKYSQRNYFHFCIELGNEKTFERINCIKLTGSENNYSFLATSFITEIRIRWRLRPQLLVVWPSFHIRHQTLNTIQSFNGQINISLTTAYKLYKLIQEPFYAIPLTHRLGKYNEIQLVSDTQGSAMSRNIAAPDCAIGKTTSCKLTTAVKATAPLMSLSVLTLNTTEGHEENQLDDGQVV